MKKSICSLLLLASLASGDFLRDDSKSIVLDTSTNLMWQDDNRTIGDTNKKNWDDSISFCEGLDLAGYTNWHLPNFNELYGLANRNKYSPAISEVFQNVVSSYYWSSTADASYTSTAWFVNFDNGYAASTAKASTFYFRCVRLADND